MGESTGSKTLPTGVTDRNGTIRIWWMWQKKRQWETLEKFPATERGYAAASVIRNRLAEHAKWGTLTNDIINELCGNDDAPKSTPTFLDYARLYLKQSTVGKSTLREYAKSLDKYWIPPWYQREIHTITAKEVRTAIADINWPTDKTRNNNLTPLRGVFAIALDDEVITTNPVDKIKNTKHQSPPPDPFSRDEMARLLHWLRDEHGKSAPVYWLYFEIAFWTGMRTGELLALTWHDIDFNNGLIKVSKVMSDGEVVNRTKTVEYREVFFNSRSEEALKRLKRIKSPVSDRLFMSPRFINAAWQTDKTPRRTLTEAMRATGIRHRATYTTRHTFITNCLTDGLNIYFVAKQTGHSVRTLETRYARWIDVSKARSEIAKLDVGKG